MAETVTKPTRGMFKDLEGSPPFERWTVVSYAGSNDGALWLCRCECGTERVVKAANLLSGKSTSCGCYHKAMLKARTARRPPKQRIVPSLCEIGEAPKPGELRCGRCKANKDAEEFSLRRLKKLESRGFRSYICNGCLQEAAKQPHRRALANAATKRFLTKLKETDPEEYARRQRVQNLKRYGLNHKTYDKMLAAQRGECAICHTTDPKGRGGKFSIDHDHTTGAVRGLLCTPCNTAIGALRDDPQILMNAVDYLLKHKDQ